MRFFWSVVGGFVLGVISFVVFNVAYIEWAVRRYPHNNSMAGLAAFVYGVPVGLACWIIAALVIAVALKKNSYQTNSSETATEASAY